MRFRAVVLLALALAACRAASGAPCDEPIEASRAPTQSGIESDAAEIRLSANGSDFVLTRLARYRVAARVLASERYYLGWQSTLAPLDLALGWGYMADSSVDRFISWSQSGRWYFYHYPAESPYQAETIHSESANTHVVPGSGNLKRALLGVHTGDTVLLTGYLIGARRADADHTEWSSSLSRTDSGGGACELMLVDRLVTKGVEYR